MRKLTAAMLPSPPAQPQDGLAFWRQRIFLTIAVCQVILGLGAYLSGASEFARQGRWGMVVVDSIFYLLALVIAFARNIRLEIRFNAVLLIFYLVGLALLLANGTSGSGLIWLFAFSALGGTLLGVRSAVVTIGINAVTLLIIGLVAHIHPESLPQWTESSSVFITIAIDFMSLNTLVSLSLAILTDGLEKSLRREKETSRSLEEAIAEHKLAEAERKINEERLKLALEAINDGLWDWNLLTNEVYYSPRYQTMLGYEPGEIAGNFKSWEDLTNPEDRQRTLTITQDHLKKNLPFFESEFRMKTKNGNWLWILGRGKVVERDAQGKAIRMVGTHTDISERKRMQAELENERLSLARRVAEQTAELQAANQELLRASKMKDEFLASMSHELRTPLNAVLGMSEALLEEVYGPLNKKQHNSLVRVQESGYHLLNLINDILDISKMEAGEMSLEIVPLSVAEITGECLAYIERSAAEKQIEIQLDLDPLALHFTADHRRFKQILINLLSNAVKFTLEGGKVGLDVEGDRENNAITFSVWDNGIGIDPMDLPRLFKPFVQLDSSLSRRYTGSGLGLALIQRLTELHLGSIQVESKPGAGSRFTVTLPWNLSGQPQTSPPEVQDTLLRTIHKAVVIEDSDIAAEQICRYLQELGLTCQILPASASFTPQALAALQPDVIILDILLPHISGWQILKQLKQDPLTEAIPVIVVTVVNEPEKGLALGAAGYLQKPISRSALAQALHHAQRARKLPVSSQPAEQSVPKTGLILLAEDNASNAETILDYLEVSGYRTAWAKNGLEVIESARQSPPDLILMDMQMPEMDGLEATRRIRSDAALALIPIVALTALAMPGDRERFLNAGVNDYLSKPISLKKLIEVIAQLLQN
jgi:PAS domain S-box-containing protein